MAFKITAGNIDDRKYIPDLMQNLAGKLIGDKGYISIEVYGILWLIYLVP